MAWVDVPVLLRVIVSLYAGIFLAGFSATSIIQYFLKPRLTRAEFWSVAIVLSFFINPIAIALSAIYFSSIHPYLPFIISFSLAAVALCVGKRPSCKTFPFPLIIIGTVYTIIISIIVFAYSTLPDSDPYTWLTRTTEFIAQGSLPSLIDRPIFYSLVYLMVVPAHIDPYFAFKYIMPYALLLVLPSLWLVARRLPDRLSQTVVMLTPFLSASTLLYFTTPIPQAFMMVLLVTVACWLIHAHLTKKQRWYYASGALMVAGYLYHESSLLLLFPWLIVTTYRLCAQLSLKSIKANWLTAFLLIALLITNIHVFYKPFSLMRYWTTTAWYHIGELNLLFPAQYKNIDSNDVGWGNLAGVIQYYSYYIGPPIVALFLYIAYMYVRSRQYRGYFLQSLRSSPAAMVIVGEMIIFFSLSEIIPRLLNVAFLPERTWIFTGIFALYFFVTYILFAHAQSKKMHVLFSVLLILLSCISIGAALFINNGKARLIPKYQLQAATWIRNNLPRKSTVMTTNNGNLLTFHAKSQVVLLGPEFFCAKSASRSSIIAQISAAQLSINTQIVVKSRAKEELRQYVANNQDFSLARTLESTQALLDAENKELKHTDVKDNVPLYVFYAKADKQNPYGARPYIQKNPLHNCNQPTLREYPDLFQEVYNDHDMVIIWKIK